MGLFTLPRVILLAMIVALALKFFDKHTVDLLMKVLDPVFWRHAFGR